MKTRIPLEEAERLAEQIIKALRPLCEKIEVAGSIRRQRPTVGDIEIVAIPRRQRVLIGEGYNYKDPTELDLFLRRKTKLERDGGKAKRWYTHHGRQIDLYLPEPENYGAILLIRTGSADFSRWIVTPQAQQGAMPPGMAQIAGYLTSNGQKIDTPTEASYFKAIGLPMIPPAIRDQEHQDKWKHQAATAPTPSS